MANLKRLDVGLVLVLLAVGWLWLRTHDAKVRAEALSAARADSVVAALAVQDSVYGAYVRMDSAYTGEIIKLQDSLQMQYIRLDSVRLDSRRLVDSILTLENLPPIVRVVVDTLIAEADACHAALGNCSGTLLLWERRVDLCTDQLATCRFQRRGYADLYLEAQKASKPSIFKRLEIALPFMGAATILTLLIR